MDTAKTEKKTPTVISLKISRLTCTAWVVVEQAHTKEARLSPEQTTAKVN